MTCELRSAPAPRTAALLALAFCLALAAGPRLLGAALPALRVPCVLKSLAGVPCPTCGLTRAAEALSRGDLSGALRLQPLGTAAALAGLLALGAWCAARLAGVRPHLRLAAGEALGLRVAGGYLLFANWLYLVENGI